MTDLEFDLTEELAAIREFKENGEGLVYRTLTPPASPQHIREKLHLTREAFAALMGVSKRTLEQWEQGRRTPQGPALSLLRIAEQNPKAFLALK